MIMFKPLQLFGYIQSSAEEMEDIIVGEEVSIFTVSKRRRVGEAAGKNTEFRKSKKKKNKIGHAKKLP